MSEKKRITRFLQIVLFLIFISVVFIEIKTHFIETSFKNVKNLFDIIELKTFDVRQKITAGHKKTSDEIVIIEIDEKSYSSFTQKMGEWPVSRDIYADVIEYIEQQNPKAVTVDLMFINSDKYAKQNDVKLAKTLEKYNNVFSAINFDDDTSRPQPTLPQYYKITPENHSKYNLMYNPNLIYKNCRTLIPEIMTSVANIGNANVLPDADGTYRAVSPFLIYQNEYYPHLALQKALYIFEKQIPDNGLKTTIDKQSNILIADKKIPLTNGESVILNWYKDENFKSVSFYDVWEQATTNKQILEKDIFKDKIIYIGATAKALYDLKVSPINSSMPGVILHATFMNNLLDESFIHKTSKIVDIGISLILCLLVVASGLKLKKQLVFIGLFPVILVSYGFLSEWIMDKFNIWIPLVYPIISIFITFIVMYIIKYTMKARDFEYTYKLATTDGLTELYNHRFFQEQLVISMESAKRYKHSVSLIILDIDFFKKFNDKYGHQAGDAVLRQVAQILKKTVRSTDLVCRYGGEEMTIILSNTKLEEAVIIANKICDKIAQTPFKLNATTTVNVTVSMGVAEYPLNAQTKDDVIAFADKGLYIAKENGRNQVRVFE